MTPSTRLIFAVAALTIAASAGFGAGRSHYRSVISKMETTQAQREAQIATAVLESQQEQITQLQGALDEAHEKTVQLQRDSAAATAANGKLRQSLADYRAKHANTTASTGQGEPDSDPVGVLADLLGRMGEAGERISRYADEVKIAGAACEAAWPTHANSESKP